MSDKKAQIVKKLQDARQGLLDTLATLTPAQWETAVFPGDDNSQWTITDLLRHLADSERGMMGQAQAWQAGKDPIPPDFDLARWNASAVRKRKEKTVDELLAELTSNRTALLTFIDSLSDDWQKTGRHASLRILTIEQALHLIADHETDHTRNIREAIA